MCVCVDGILCVLYSKPVNFCKASKRYIQASAYNIRAQFPKKIRFSCTTQLCKYFADHTHTHTHMYDVKYKHFKTIAHETDGSKRRASSGRALLTNKIGTKDKRDGDYARADSDANFRKLEKVAHLDVCLPRSKYPV